MKEVIVMSTHLETNEIIYEAISEGTVENTFINLVSLSTDAMDKGLLEIISIDSNSVTVRTEDNNEIIKTEVVEMEGRYYEN